MLKAQTDVFMGCDSPFEQAGTVLFGAPFDSTTSNRPGARFGPNAIRRESYGLELYSPYQDRDLSDLAVLDTGDNTLSYEGQRLELTRNEYRILQVLLEHKGSTVSRDTLMRKLWETDSFVDENTLTVNMARLRRKLEGIGLKNFVRTKKGMGYLVE